MNSKEALQDIRDYHIEIIKKLDIIEEDLEVLEAFKYFFLNSKKEQKIITKELMYNATKIREWLENNKENE